MAASTLRSGIDLPQEIKDICLCLLGQIPQDDALRQSLVEIALITILEHNPPDVWEKALQKVAKLHGLIMP